MGNTFASVESEFSFLFSGGIHVVGNALEKIQKGAAGRLSSLGLSVILAAGGDQGSADAVAREFRVFAGEMFGRVSRGGYDRRKFRARGALRSLVSAIEYAGWGMTAEAVGCMHDALRESGAALAR